MLVNEQDLLSLVKDGSLRFARGADRYGIGVAASYLRSLEGCLTGGVCPERAFRLASPDQWGAALKEAEQRLVYCDPAMRAGEFKSLAGGMLLSDPRSIMEFECRITSTRQDRDGDVLESQGAIIDPRMPLLWQHVPLEPIGKLLEVTRHEATFVDGRFAIADTTLGRDAALLVEFGALRISHGFRPLEYEPMFRKGAGGEQEFVGFLVHRFEVMEASLVSVPSNTDATITQFSRSKLHHPAVKRWAKRFFEQRKRHARGMSFSDESIPVASSAKDLPASPVTASPVTASPAKDADPRTGDALRETAQPEGGKEAAPGEAACRCSLAAGAPSGAESPAAPPPADGSPPASGPAMKAGRTLSRKNEDALTQACELLRECADRDDVPRAAKAIVREALGLVQGVLDQLPKPTTDQPEGGDPAESGPTTETGVTGAGLTETGLVETARILREVLAGDLDTIERYRDFNRRLHAALDLRQRALDDAEMEAICAEFGL